MRAPASRLSITARTRWRRSIDAGAGHTLAAALRASGVTVVPNARSVGVELRPGPDGEPAFSALLQESGASVEGELLVLSCGVRPRVEVAAGAGLATGRGILVDHRLAALHDPNVFAMGDCARDPLPGRRLRRLRRKRRAAGPDWPRLAAGRMARRLPAGIPRPLRCRPSAHRS